MSNKKKLLIIILSLIGLGLSIELCFVYYNAHFSANTTPSICAINEAFDCDSVAKTEYSQFLGIPLALYGVCLYLFFLFMTFVDKLQNIKFLGFLKVFKNQSSYIYCVGLLSFTISMILGCISIFEIHSVCIFCFMTYFIDLFIALTAKNWGSGALFELKNSVSDFIEAIKVKRYAFWFCMLVMLAISVLSYTETSNILTPQIASKKMIQRTFENYEKIADGNELGSKNADLVIHEYIDFNCGGCFFANLYTHRIVSEFENVRLVQHILPLEKKCNHNMKHDGHKNSCLKAQYALAAKKQNKYWQMSDLFFFSADLTETEEQILHEAKKYGFDVKKLKTDAHSEEIKKEIEAGVLDADSKDIYGTPTLYIGIKKQIGAGSYLELRQTVIEQGGKEKVNNNG